METMSSLTSRIAAGVSALGISLFLIAASFAPPGAVAFGSGIVA